MTTSDLAHWIFQNKKGDAFNGWSFDEIHIAVIDSMSKNTLTYVHDGATFIGVIMAVLRNDFNLHIYGALATKPHVLRKMAMWLHKTYPDKTVTAIRGHKMVVYSLERVLQKLK